MENWFEGIADVSVSFDVPVGSITQKRSTDTPPRSGVKST